MPIKCPKCGHERGPGEKAPAWQCPGCGVAYTKVMSGGAGEVPPPMPVELRPPEPAPQAVEVGFPSEMAVHVVDVRMPFLSMVTFMVKWAVASIPAVIILVFLAMVTQSLIAGMLGRSLVDGLTKSERSAAAAAAERAAKDKEEAIASAIRAGRVLAGMTQAQVRAAWGEPDSRDVTTTGAARSEMWRYTLRDGVTARMVLFADGVVVSVVGPD